MRIHWLYEIHRPLQVISIFAIHFTFRNFLILYNSITHRIMKKYICQHCFIENPVEAYICHSCHSPVGQPGIFERESNMDDFSRFFLKTYINLDTGKPITLYKTDSGKGRISYNFWLNRISMWWLVFLPIHFLIHPLWMTCVLIVHFLKRYTLWEAYFDEYGWITQIRNNHEKPEWQVLEAYAQYNTKYALYFDRYIQKNPSFSQKSGNHKNGAFLTGYWIGYLIFSLICSVLIYFIKQLYIG